MTDRTTAEETQLNKATFDLEVMDLNIPKGTVLPDSTHSGVPDPY